MTAAEQTKDPDLAAVVGDEPLTVESTTAGLGLDPTPPEALFVRNNLETPAIRDWRVEVEGVIRPTSKAPSDLVVGLERVEVTAVLQCAGNGRARLADPVPGVQWDMGGMGCPRWSGVRVADVLQLHGGPVPGATFLTTLGADASLDDPSRVERSIPLEVAMERGILADTLDGEPIPFVHGGPLRLVVPGYYAVNSVKWVRRIAATDAESDATIQTTRYRLSPPGSDPGPLHPSLWEMGPKAVVIDVDAAGSGDLVVTGVAFSGDGGLNRVEVSGDDGDTWSEASLSPGAGPFAWRRFEARLSGPAERVAARATAGSGVQPRHTVPTVDGYAIDGWSDLAYTVEAEEA